MPSVFAQDFSTKQSALFIACPCFNTTYHPHQYLSHYLLVDMKREFGNAFHTSPFIHRKTEIITTLQKREVD